MLEYRRLAKLVDTYSVTWFKDSYRNGRVYPDWFQLGTVTGRMSCASPNLQQLPGAGPYRSCIRAPEGRTLVIADYLQIELRIAAKITADEGMLEAFHDPDTDIHTQTATIVTGKSAEEVTKEERTKAKAINFGLLYGMQKESLPGYALKNYGVAMTSTEAMRFYRRYFEARKELKAWHDKIRRLFFENGRSLDMYTLTGRRRRRITKLTEVFNHPVQGTGADGLKYALVLLHEQRGEFPTATPTIACHDEIVYECDEGEGPAVQEWLEEVMVEAMNDVVNSTGPEVPIQVEGGVSKAWAKD